jgi:hypothetical protein
MRVGVCSDDKDDRRASGWNIAEDMGCPTAFMSQRPAQKPAMIGSGRTVI